MSSIDSFFPPSIEVKNEEFTLDKVKNQTKADAVDYLNKFKMIYRIVKEDNTKFAYIANYRLDRLNLTIENGVVTDMTYG